MGLKLIVLDCETSGVNVAEDRIITCAIRVTDDKELVTQQLWVIDPGIEIPKEASEIHGMTTEWVQENGRKDVNVAIHEIYDTLRYYSGEYVIAGYNHAFDLAMLEAEVHRHTDMISFKSSLDTLFLDPLILDRKLDKYRKGSRKLIDVAKHYGVEVDENKLHDALYDVEITEKLIPKVLNMAWKKTKPDRPEMNPENFISWLQDKQGEWKKEWAEGLTKYFAREGKTEDDGSPIIVEGRFPW